MDRCDNRCIQSCYPNGCNTNSTGYEGTYNAAACNINYCPSLTACNYFPDRRASYFNWGLCVDIFAPGCDVIAASQTSTSNSQCYQPIQTMYSHPQYFY